MPRFLAEADAGAGAASQNPPGSGSGTSMPLAAGHGGPVPALRRVGLGLLCLVLPGLLALFAFGWAPLRVLLRGETLADAARGSLRMMVRSWRRVLPVALGWPWSTSGTCSSSSLALAGLGAEPTPWQRLTHPGLWAGNFIGTLLNVWSSVCFLALFRRVEAGAEAAPPGPGPGIN